MSVQQSPRNQMFTAGWTSAEFFVVEIRLYVRLPPLMYVHTSTVVQILPTQVLRTQVHNAHMHKMNSSRAHPYPTFPQRSPSRKGILGSSPSTISYSSSVLC